MSVCLACRVTLFTGQWADLPLADVAAGAAGFGYDGLELACWSDHLHVERASADPAYCAARRALLDVQGLGCWAISNHLAGQLVCDPNDERSDAFALQGAEPDPLALDFPTVDDGLRGMLFIKAVVRSARSGEKWTRLARM